MTQNDIELRPGRSRWLIGVAVLALLMAACGGGHKQAASTSATVPADWTTFSATAIDISLPNSFVGGAQDSKTLGNAVAQLQGMGQADLASKLQSMTPNEAMQMVDGDGSAAVTVFDVPADPELDPASYDIYSTLNPAASGLKLIKQTTVDIGSLKAQRLQMHSDSLAIDMIAYYIRKNTTLWSFVYTSSPSTSDRWTPIFDQSAQTIRIAN